MAKMLYDYWFVQFDFPDNDNKPYKANADKMMWNDQLKREIPDGWKVHKVGEILDVSLGGTPSTSNPDYWENGTINWLSSGEMNNFPIVKAESKITEEALNNSATKLMPKGTVAISITRYIRPTILAIDSCANQSVVGIHESSIFKSSYLYPLFLNEVARYMVIRTGAMQPHINKETINSTPIIEPSDLVLEKYYKIATPIYQKIINNAKQNQELIELRDFILPLLMNGQVRVN
jgi:type I restriction enzyme S subunit